MAAANATRPILPVNGGVRQVNVLMNLGVADYDGLQTQVSYRGNAKMYAAVSYTLSKATNTTEPDGNGIGPNRRNIVAARRRGARTERARSASSRGHHVQLPAAVQHHGRHGDAARVGASVQRHDRRRQQRRRREQRPARRQRRGHRQVGVPRHRRRRTSALFVEGRIKLQRAQRSCCGWRASTSSITANILGRAQTTYGDTGDGRTRRSASSSPSARRPTRIPAFANIDPPRMFQFQVRFIF